MGQAADMELSQTQSSGRGGQADPKGTAHLLEEPRRSSDPAQQGLNRAGGDNSVFSE